MTKKAKAAQLLLKIGGKLPESFLAPPKAAKPKMYVLTEKDKQDIASKVSVPIVEKVIEKNKTTEVIRELPSITKETTIVKELDQDQLKKLVYEFLSNHTPGGGNANRNIQVDGSNVLRPFTDINLIAGSGVTIGAVANQVTKYTDITLTASGGAALSKTFTYNMDGSLNVVTDALGTKTMGYTDGVLTTITGTGVYPNKTFGYTDGVLTSVTVS